MMHERDNRLSYTFGGNSSERILFWLMPLLKLARFLIIAALLIIILTNGSSRFGLFVHSTKRTIMEFIEATSANNK